MAKDKIIIGYTTGVWDLFHQGHLTGLRNAKALCDKLIVGVTTDELSLSAKNKKPIVPFKERLDIISELKCVDVAVPQRDYDKFKAWEQYEFDIMFANDNPTPRWPAVVAKFKEEFTTRNLPCPKIINLPYTKGVSSTIRRAILKEEALKLISKQQHQEPDSQG